MRDGERVNVMVVEHLEVIRRHFPQGLTPKDRGTALAALAGAVGALLHNVPALLPDVMNAIVESSAKVSSAVAKRSAAGQAPTETRQ